MGHGVKVWQQPDTVQMRVLTCPVEFSAVYGMDLSDEMVHGVFEGRAYFICIRNLGLCVMVAMYYLIVLNG